MFVFKLVGTYRIRGLSLSDLWRKSIFIITKPLLTATQIYDWSHGTIQNSYNIQRVELLETLSIKNNPNLVYIHPKAIQRVPSLTTLELNNNNLTILEDIRWGKRVKLIFYKTKFSRVINFYYVNFLLKLVSKYAV